MTEQSLPISDIPAGDVAQQDDTRERHRFNFSGNAAEYFRVWIVNIALSIVTLGIYSAWAKVRNRQYFYGNSHLAGASFEYTANPVNILKGRLLVFAVFVAYNLAATFQPLVAGILVIFLIPLFPWMVVNAVRFNHRHSAYRNLRFHFDGTYGESAKVYIAWTLVMIVTFGLAYPYMAWRRKKFLVERSRYGNGQFEYRAEPGYFFVVYILAGVFYAGVLVGIGVLMGGVVALVGSQGGEWFNQLQGASPESGEAEGKLAGILFMALMVLMYLGFVLSFIVVNTGVQAAVSNYVWSNTKVDCIRFKLEINLPRVIFIQVTNLLAIVASLGLLIPWAKVRMMRYKLACFTMIADTQEIERFVGTARDAITATGDEFGEAFDLDLGL